MQWEPGRVIMMKAPIDIQGSKIFSSRIIGDTQDNFKTQNNFNNQIQSKDQFYSENKRREMGIRRKTNTMANTGPVMHVQGSAGSKKYFWNRRDNSHEITKKELEQLLSRMRLLMPLYKVIKIYSQSSKSKKLSQAINFSSKELEILFSTYKYKAVKYIFSKYRGLLGCTEMAENIILVENQMYGVQDQLHSKMLVLQEQNLGMVKQFNLNSTVFLKDSARMLVKVQRMKNNLKKSQKVSLGFWLDVIYGSLLI